MILVLISKLGNLISEYEKFEMQMQKEEEKSENTDWDNLRVVSEDKINNEKKYFSKIFLS